jgi:hypothetical protein
VLNFIRVNLHTFPRVQYIMYASHFSIANIPASIVAPPKIRCYTPRRQCHLSRHPRRKWFATISTRDHGSHILTCKYHISSFIPTQRLELANSQRIRCAPQICPHKHTQSSPNSPVLSHRCTLTAPQHSPHRLSNNGPSSLYR